MALSRVKTWIAGETLTAADLNAEFANILDNALTLVSPLTGTLDANGNVLVLDADADSSITADTDDRIDFALSGTDLFRMDGTATTPVNGLTFIARATGSKPSVQALTSDANEGLDIRDDNGNEIIIFSAVATAVNEITITNAAAGSEPSIAATGGDTDIDITLTPKGAGVLNLSAGAFNENKGSDIASATTTDIGAATGNYADVTGTTTITGLGTVKAGTRREIQFDDALILTHNATSLILPSGANITTAAGDTATFVSLGSGNWKCVYYHRVSGKALIDPTSIDVQTFTADGTYTKPSGAIRAFVQAWGAGGSGGRGSDGVRGGGGGGGGACLEHWFEASAIGATETVTIGVGGAARTTSNTSGAAGTSTTFGSLLTAYAGGGGGAAVGSGGGGGGGGSTSAGSSVTTGTGGTGGQPHVASANNDPGFGGANGGNGDAASPLPGGNAGYGGGGGGGGTTGVVTAGAGGSSYKGGGGGGGASVADFGGAGGSSVFGGAGGAGSQDAVAATAGSQPGGGGGGSENANSGAGGDGQVIVTTWITG